MDNKLITTDQLAHILRVAPSALCYWRRRGEGPPWEQHGNRFYYRLSDLLKFTGGRWPKDGRFIRAKEAAKRLGISEDALAHRRVRGAPPHPVQFGGVPLYCPEDCVPVTKVKQTREERLQYLRQYSIEYYRRNRQRILERSRERRLERKIVL